MPVLARPTTGQQGSLQAHVSAGRVTPVLLKGAQSGGGGLRRGLAPEPGGTLQTTAVPEQVPAPLVALKDTCVAQAGKVGVVSTSGLRDTRWTVVVARVGSTLERA